MLKSVPKNLPGLYSSTMILLIMARLLRGVVVHAGPVPDSPELLREVLISLVTQIGDVLFPAINPWGILGDPFEEGKDYYLYLVQGKAMELG